MFLASSKGFWLEWLEYYKSHRCLWDADSPDYSNRSLRTIAYKELASMARVVCEDAKEEFVKMRINNFRTAYRKEVKKVVIARENGLIYKPKLFYYDLLNSCLRQDGEHAFSVDFEVSAQSSSAEEDPFASLHARSISMVEPSTVNVKNSVEQFEQRSDVSIELQLSNNRRNGNNTSLNSRNSIKNNNESSTVRTAGKNQSLSYTQRLRKRRRAAKIKASRSNDTSDEDEIIPKIQRRNEDEWDVLGRRFATHFRNMKSTQRLLAEKIISDVCIYARLDQLTMQSGLTLDTSNVFENNGEHIQSKERLNEVAIHLDSNEYSCTF